MVLVLDGLSCGGWRGLIRPTGYGLRAAIITLSAEAGDDAGEGVKQQVAELNRRLKPWLFALPGYKVGVLNTPMDRLVKVQASGVGE